MDKSQYKNVYVFVEQRDGVVQNVALELLGKARELADALHEQVIALLLGKGVKDKADELIAAGADVVLSIEADELAQYTTEPYAQAITQVIHERKPSILLIGATSIGRDLGPRLSARIGTGLTADCTGLDISEDGDLLMTRPAFGGNLMATIICKAARGLTTSMAGQMMTSWTARAAPVATSLTAAKATICWSTTTATTPWMAARASTCCWSRMPALTWIHSLPIMVM